MDMEFTKFRDGFEIFIRMEGVTYPNEEGLTRQHYIVITVDAMKNAIRLYIYKEDKLTVAFNEVRDPFCRVVQAVKEYVKEHQAVDKLLGKIIC
jgi:hypothetical protein